VSSSSTRSRPASGSGPVPAPTAKASGSVPSASVYWLTAPASSTAMLCPPRPCVSSTNATTTSGVSVAIGTIHCRSRYGLMPTIEPAPRTASPNGTAVSRITNAAYAIRQPAHRRRRWDGSAASSAATPSGSAFSPPAVAARRRYTTYMPIRTAASSNVSRPDSTARADHAALTARTASSTRCGSGSASGPSSLRQRRGSSATTAGMAIASPSSRRLAPVRFAVTYSAWPTSAKWTSTRYSGRIPTNATAATTSPLATSTWAASHAQASRKAAAMTAAP